MKTTTEVQADIIIRDEGYFLTFLFQTEKAIRLFKNTNHYQFFDKRTNSICAHPDYHITLFNWVDKYELTSVMV